MRSTRVVATAGLALIFVVTGSSSAFAQAFGDRATARQLGHDGEAALAAKDYKTAEDDFRRADSLVHAPTLVLGLARALTGEGKLLEAQEAYNTVIREGVAPGAPEAFAKAVADAKAEVSAIGPKLGTVTILVKTASGAAPANLKVTIDDSPVGAGSLGVKRPADPGAHVIKASADGFKPASVSVQVAGGSNADAALTLDVDPTAAAASPGAPVPGPDGSTAQPAAASGSGSPLDTPPPDTARGSGPWRTVGLVAGGVGIVGLGLGTVFGVMAISDKNGAHCDASGACDPGGLSNANSAATVSTVGFIAGGVLLAGGAALYLFGPRGDAAATGAASLRLAPAVGRNDAAVQLGGAW
jgi:hypothetical protein